MEGGKKKEKEKERERGGGRRRNLREFEQFGVQLQSCFAGVSNAV